MSELIDFESHEDEDMNILQYLKDFADRVESKLANEWHPEWEYIAVVTLDDYEFLKEIGWIKTADPVTPGRPPNIP